MKIVWLGLEQSLGDTSHDVLILNKNTFSLEKVVEFNPDIVIEREFNAEGMDWQREIHLIRQALPNIKTAVWLIDTHVRTDAHREYCKLFDYAFFAISKFIDEIDHPHKFWLPLCHTASFVPEFPEKRKYHIGFVGRYGVKHLEERTEFMYMIRDVFPEFHLVTDYNTVYQRMTDIEYIVNLSYNGDMNFRTFEALACGCGLITSDVPDLYKIEGLKEKISIFNSYKSCIDRIIEKVGVKQENNSSWVMSRHTLAHRLNSMIKMISNGIQENF